MLILKLYSKIAQVIRVLSCDIHLDDLKEMLPYWRAYIHLLFKVHNLKKLYHGSFCIFNEFLDYWCQFCLTGKIEHFVMGLNNAYFLCLNLLLYHSS